MNEDRRLIQPVTDARDPRQVEEFSRRVAGLTSPEVTATIDAAAESADTRRITIQATDRKGQRWAKVWRIEFYLSTTRDGPPVSLGHTFTIVSGTITETIVAGGHYRGLTDENGALVFDLEIADPAPRYVTIKIDGQSETSDALAWA